MSGADAVPTDRTAPSQPSRLTVGAVTSTGVTVSWTASTDNVGVTGYGVYSNGASAGSTASTSYTLSGLTCGTSYALAVDAYDAAGNRSTKATITATTARCPDTQPPTRTGGVVVGTQVVEGTDDPEQCWCGGGVSHDGVWFGECVGASAVSVE